MTAQEARRLTDEANAPRYKDVIDFINNPRNIKNGYVNWRPELDGELDPATRILLIRDGYELTDLSDCVRIAW